MSKDPYANAISTTPPVRYETADTIVKTSAWIIAWGLFVKVWDFAARWLLSFVGFIGKVVEHGIVALSKLITIKIGILDTSKVHLCEQIKLLEDELATARMRNKRLDAENYVLHEAIGELERGGNMAYDKCVQWFGKDCEQAVRWRDALYRANATRGYFYEEASEYYGARCNTAWAAEHDKKKEDENHKGRSSSKRKRKR